MVNSSIDGKHSDKKSSSELEIKNIISINDSDGSGIVSDHSLLNLDISAIELASENSDEYSKNVQGQIYEKLRNLLRQIKISDEDEIQECLKLFEGKQFSELESTPSKKYREKFKSELSKLREWQEKHENWLASEREKKERKMKEEKKKDEPNGDIEKDFVRICKDYNLEDSLEECWDLWKKKDIDALKDYPKRKYR